MMMSGGMIGFRILLTSITVFLAEGYFSAPNSLLSEILDILQPYYEMTKILSAANYPTLNLVYPSMFKLIRKVSPPEYDDDHYAESASGMCITSSFLSSSSSF